MPALLLPLCTGLGLCCLYPPAQADEAATELQIGAAAERATQSGTARIGPSASVEFNAIEHWLQLEFGVTAFQSQGTTEWETELSFKRPFDLTPSIELTVGIGPTWTHSGSTTGHRDSFGAEFSLDFQFWIGRRTGWYVEPGYSVDHNYGTQRSVGIAVGLLFAFR